MSVNKVSNIMCELKSNQDMLDRSLRSLSKSTPLAHDSASDVKSSSNPAQETAAPEDPTHEESIDSKVASLLRKFTQKTGMSIEDIEQLCSHAPAYHIRLDCDGEEHKRSGDKCILCDKDLSCSPNDVDRADEEQKYRVKFTPQYLPAVDILPCGHVIHTDCSKYAMSGESNVPICMFCLSMP